VNEEVSRDMTGEADGMEFGTATYRFTVKYIRISENVAACRLPQSFKLR